MKLVRHGHSWSGNEKNRFFRNGGAGKFHEMSHLAGLDQPEDGRGLAVVDWDQDGRLDLWYRNRSAPRLRLMLNRREAGRSVSLKLEGTSANHDGIGAVVELLPAQDETRLVRSVRAGDLFLSQSSRWLHFGSNDKIDGRSALVIWPGGARERFEGIGNEGRFLLKQGTGKAVAQPKRSAFSFKTDLPLTGHSDEGNARIVLPSRIPLPKIAFRDQAAQSRILPADRKPRLLLLWSGTCPHCRTSIVSIASNANALRTAGLDVLALAVDGLSGPSADLSAAFNVIDSTSFPFAWGVIDAPSAARLHRFQEKLFDRTPASSVPLAILLDQAGQTIAIYRGEFLIDNVVRDWTALGAANELQLHHSAPPLRGTWFTNPLPQRDVMRVFGFGTASGE